MRFIYLKIFVWFWLAMIAVGGTLGFVVAKTGNRSIEPPGRREMAALLPPQAERIVEVFESKGAEAVKEYEKTETGPLRLEFHLFDASGNDLTHDTPSPAIVTLAEEAKRSGKVAWMDDRLMHSGAVAVAGPSGQRYVYAMVSTLTSPLPPLPPLNASPFNQVIRIFSVVCVGGFVCFLLARYISSPVGQLRSAARALARGDLRARIPLNVCRRTDELGDLGVDFNTMADRIQSLVESQHRLLRDISHEMRSPLARLRVALDLAKDGADPRSLRAHDRVEVEAERINEMIGQLLHLSRLESLAEAPDKAKLDLSEVVERTVSEADLEASQAGVTIKVLRNEPCFIAGNEVLLHSVVENLLRNAMRYTPAGTAIEVELAKRQETGKWYAVLSVKDSGPGVPEAHLADIFSAFFRVENSRNCSTGGVGLGLSIAQRAVLLHNGSIHARNRERDGLEVEVRLPLSDMAEPAAV